MINTSIYIKNMVCPRCLTAVELTLTKLKIPFSKVKLGEAVIEAENIDYAALDKELRAIGFEIIQNKNQKIVEQIKTLVVDLIHHNKADDLKINISDFLSKNLGYQYSYISNIFSKEESITIEKFIIFQKIEKVKELLDYNELNFSEIAFSLHYSSASHLSKQFKKITGFTLSEYKKTKPDERNSIDNML
jgi:AraC-like DNA-binding protein